MKPLGDCSMALVKAHSKLVVKATGEPRYKIFEEEAKNLVDNLQSFLTRASTLCAEADIMTEVNDDQRLEELAVTIVQQTACAESHKIGATKSVGRFNAMCEP